MVKTAIGFLIGCLSVLSLPDLPGIGGAALCFLVLIIALLLKKWGLFWLFLGCLWAGFQASLVLHDRLPVSKPNQDMLLQGKIADIPIQHAHRIIFQFIPDQQIRRLPHKIKVNWYYPPNKTPKAGETWQLRIRLKPVHSQINPGGFDYERWLFIHHIGATGYVLKSTNNHRLAKVSNFSIDNWREKIRHRIKACLPNRNNLGLIEGLTVGYRADISTSQWQILRQTGTSHLMAISGLHIGLAAAFGFLLLRWLWACSYRLMHLFPANQAGACGGILLALGYALLAGFSIPTQRAFMMISIVMLALLLRRRHYRTQIVALSLLLVLIHDPFAVLSPGFWLSYGAVSLLLMTQHKQGQPSHWYWTRSHIMLALGLSPLLLLFFGQISLIAPLANLIAIPLVSFITVPLLLVAVSLMAITPSLAKPVLHLADYSLSGLWQLLTTLANWPISSLTIPDLPFSLILLLTFGTVLFMLPRGIPGRWLGLLTILPCFLFRPASPPRSAFWFNLLDVGQGLAAVIQTQHHCLVFDTGPAFNNSYNAGTSVILPFLHARHISHIDTLVVSHGDNDHIGGAPALITAMPPKQILTSVPNRLPNANHCYSGQHWRWDGVQFDMLAPNPADQGSANNLSCVLRVSNAQGSVLLTGDIEREAEQRLVQRYHDKLHSQILVAPHHGSRTSSSARFIDAVAPQFVLFPVGYHNRYHFPVTQIVNRYHRRGIHDRQTDENGNIEIRFATGQSLSVIDWRHKNPHIWRWKATE